MSSVVYPTNGHTAQELIQRADGALYLAKARSENVLFEAWPTRAMVQADTQPPATRDTVEILILILFARRGLSGRQDKRRNISPATPSRPASIIAQLSGSGTARPQAMQVDLPKTFR